MIYTKKIRSVTPRIQFLTYVSYLEAQILLTKASYNLMEQPMALV